MNVIRKLIYGKTSHFTVRYLLSFFFFFFAVEEGEDVISVVSKLTVEIYHVFQWIQMSVFVFPNDKKGIER